MTRISKVPPEKWDPTLRAMSRGDKATSLEKIQMSVSAHVPAFAIAQRNYLGAMLQNTTLSRRLLELVRLRIAFHNQCRSCMAIRYQTALDDGMTEGMVCSLEKPLEAPDLTEAEKAAILYADISSTNHFAINDETFAGLRKHFTEGQIVELGMFIAFFIGYGRLAASWDMVEELPKSYQDKSANAVPWARESLVVNDKAPA